MILEEKHVEVLRNALSNTELREALKRLVEIHRETYMTRLATPTAGPLVEDLYRMVCDRAAYLALSELLDAIDAIASNTPDNTSS